MGINLSYIEGQTPIDEDEKSGLKIKTITTRNELDEWEQLNIEDAIKWSIKIKKTAEDLITADFVRDLHTRMYGRVWKWAGQVRNTNKNIGVDKLLYIKCALRLNVNPRKLRCLSVSLKLS